MHKTCRPTFCDGCQSQCQRLPCFPEGALSHGARQVPSFWDVHPTFIPLNGPHRTTPTGGGGRFRTARAQRQLLRCSSREHPLKTTPLQKDASSIQTSIGVAEFRTLGPVATGGGRQSATPSPGAPSDSGAVLAQRARSADYYAADPGNTPCKPPTSSSVHDPFQTAPRKRPQPLRNLRSNKRPPTARLTSVSRPPGGHQPSSAGANHRPPSIDGSLVQLHFMGAFSHSAGTAPIITVFIPGTPPANHPPTEACIIHSKQHRGWGRQVMRTSPPVASAPDAQQWQGPRAVGLPPALFPCCWAPSFIFLRLNRFNSFDGYMMSSQATAWVKK